VSGRNRWLTERRLVYVPATVAIVGGLAIAHKRNSGPAEALPGAVSQATGGGFGDPWLETRQPGTAPVVSHLGRETQQTRFAAGVRISGSVKPFARSASTTRVAVSRARLALGRLLEEVERPAWG
jgi:hypothetical protein